MALRTTAQSKEAGRAPLPLNSRRDTWWIRPLLTVIVLGSFVIYSAWRGLENQFAVHRYIPPQLPADLLLLQAGLLPRVLFCLTRG